MILETIREVVSTRRTAESSRRGEEVQNGRNLHWEAILIKWTYGRTHRPISTDLLNAWHHHLSCLPSSYFFFRHYISSFFSVFPNSVFPLIKSLSLTLLLSFFSTFTLFPSHFLLPSFMLGGHSPVKEFNMQLLYEKPIAYVWVYWARNLSARTANAIESAGAIYHTGSYLFLPLSRSLPVLLTLPSLALSLFKPRFQAATKSGQLWAMAAQRATSLL